MFDMNEEEVTTHKHEKKGKSLYIQTTIRMRHGVQKAFKIGDMSEARCGVWTDTFLFLSRRAFLTQRI